MDESGAGNPQWTWPCCCLERISWTTDRQRADLLRGTGGRCHTAGDAHKQRCGHRAAWSGDDEQLPS
eukprot:9241907-Prorocentrum_lima.AAC.1